MINLVTSKKFANGIVYMLRTKDGYPLETTDTFLPYYTKNCINEHTNELKSNEIGDRNERWMIGVSCMSGCPVHCKFCATGQLKQFRNLRAEEIYSQVEFILEQNPDIDITKTKEFKINYTRMGEPFLNLGNVRRAIKLIEKHPRLQGVRVHHYISTIGIKGSDFSWIKDNITLQISLHSLDESRRHDLIPLPSLMTIKELGEIRTESSLKTTVNMTLVDNADFDIEKLKKYFDKDYFFIKLSPVNKNVISESNDIGDGIIKGQNII